MSPGLRLILSTTLVPRRRAAHGPIGGASPYRGDPAAVLADFDLAEATRTRLRALMQATCADGAAAPASLSAQARSRSGCACAGHGDTKKASTIAASTSATVAGFQRGE